jgi:hypothetical protein
MWSYVGEVAHEEFLLGKSIQGARVYLYPHLHFSLGFNNDQIVAINVTTDPKRRIDITDPVVGQEVHSFSNSSQFSSSHSPLFRLCSLILLNGFTNLG